MTRPARIAAIVALALGSATAGYALRGAPAAAGTTAAREDAEVAPEPEGALAACREKLSRRDAELVAARRMASRAAGGAGVDDPEPSEPPPVEGPRGFDGHEWVDAPDPVEAAHRRADIRERVGGSLARVLRLTPEEEAVAKDLICALRANQRSLFAEYDAGRIDDDALWRTMRDERETVTEGLERTLGAERWRRLQELGGLPIFSQTMCQRR